MARGARAGERRGGGTPRLAATFCSFRTTFRTTFRAKGGIRALSPPAATRGAKAEWSPPCGRGSDRGSESARLRRAAPPPPPRYIWGARPSSPLFWLPARGAGGASCSPRRVRVPCASFGAGGHPPPGLAQGPPDRPRCDPLPTMRRLKARVRRYLVGGRDLWRCMHAAPRSSTTSAISIIPSSVGRDAGPPGDPHPPLKLKDSAELSCSCSIKLLLHSASRALSNLSTS